MTSLPLKLNLVFGPLIVNMSSLAAFRIVKTVFSTDQSCCTVPTMDPAGEYTLMFWNTTTNTFLLVIWLGDRIQIMDTIICNLTGKVLPWGLDKCIISLSRLSRMFISDLLYVNQPVSSTTLNTFWPNLFTIVYLLLTATNA